MNKKAYMKTAMQVVKIQQTRIICASVTGTTSNVNMTYGRGGSDVARSRGCDDWDDNY